MSWSSRIQTLEEQVEHRLETGSSSVKEARLLDVSIGRALEPKDSP